MTPITYLVCLLSFSFHYVSSSRGNLKVLSLSWTNSFQECCSYVRHRPRPWRFRLKWHSINLAVRNRNHVGELRLSSGDGRSNWRYLRLINHRWPYKFQANLKNSFKNGVLACHTQVQTWFRKSRADEKANKNLILSMPSISNMSRLIFFFFQKCNFWFNMASWHGTVIGI